jgi:hypothetical protein
MRSSALSTAYIAAAMIAMTLAASPTASAMASNDVLAVREVAEGVLLTDQYPRGKC